MSKGNNPPAKKPRPQPVPRRPKKQLKVEGEGGGTSGTSSSPPECWTFQLSDPTPAGRSVSEGMAVQGVPQAPRVMIVAVIGTLGFAPSSVSKSMLSAIRITGGRLSGEIRSSGSRNSAPQIELCAFRDD